MAGKSYWNGILLGVSFGGAALFMTKNITQINFIADWVNNGATALLSQTWWPAGISVAFAEYGIAMLAGALVGLYVESK